VGGQASRLQLLLFLTATINLSFRLSNSLVRLSDSFAESLIRGGRSILSSFNSFNLLALYTSRRCSLSLLSHQLRHVLIFVLLDQDTHDFHE
jgi:hypothetical protein